MLKNQGIASIEQLGIELKIKMEYVDRWLQIDKIYLKKCLFSIFATNQ